MRLVPFTDDGGRKLAPRLSPDGERVAYSWIRPDSDNAVLCVKAIGRGTKPLTLTEHKANDWGPVWSPDGRQIAFVIRQETGAAIYTVPSLGGQERRLIEVAGPVRLPDGSYITVLSWSPDGEWLALAEKPLADQPARIVRLSLATLEKRQLTFPPANSVGDLYPELSPDGRTLAFVRSASRVWGGWDVWVQAVNRPQARQVTFEKFDYCGGLAWTPDAREVVFSTGRGFQGGGRILRVPVAGGAPAPVAGIGSDAVWPSVRAGRMVHEQLTPASRGIWRVPGRRSAITDRKPEKLITSRWNNEAPSYSPDGRRIAFSSDRRGPWSLWVSDEDGANPVQLTDLPCGVPQWSPDGRRIVCISGASGNPEVYVVDSEGGVPRRLTHDPSEKTTATFSRDGRFIYYASDISGGWQIWKMPADGGSSVQVTRGGGYFAQESWDSRYLYHSKAHDGGGLWRVPVEGGEEAPVSGVNPPTWTYWALSRDGIYWATYHGGIWHEDYKVHFFDFRTGRSEMLFRKQGPYDTLWLAVSPDEKWILYGEAPVVQSELMLVENFR
jgi:Tol biopolymer transport system component